MKCPNYKNSILLILFALVVHSTAWSQYVPQGFFYQTEVRTPSRTIIANQNVNFLFSIYASSVSGTPVWQETQLLASDNYGLVRTTIGIGTTTGVGSLSSFSQIDWGATNYFLQVYIDSTGGSSFVPMGFSPFYSVPYAFHSSYTEMLAGFSLPDLSDVSVSTITIGKLLKWDGTVWKTSVDNDSDTVSFVLNSGSSITSDTSLYTFGNLTSDTVLFANNSDSALFAQNSLNAITVDNAENSDTAVYAIDAPAFAWKTNGNAIGIASSKYIGTNDNVDFAIKTNNTLKATVKNDGTVLIGAAANTAILSLLSNDGILAVGQIDSSFSSVSGAGTKMLWYPSLGSFRAGAINSNQWDLSNNGKYSTAFGYNTIARIASFSSGSDCQAMDYSVAIGRKSQANGVGPYPRGNVFALGDSCIGYAFRSVTIGRGNFADSTATSNGSTSVLIGNSNYSIGVVSVCLGSNCYSGGTRSNAIGYHAYASHVGSFVYSDASATSNTMSTINNQFLVRASGGVVFYSDSLNTMGVILNPGSGSWAVVSDRNKKENFTSIDYEAILDNIDRLKIKTWNYKAQHKSIKHIGPMAQDFHRLFGFGEDEKTISTADADGVILSGIKALNNRINDLTKLNDVDKLKSQIDKVTITHELNTDRLDAIDALINDIKK